MQLTGKDMKKKYIKIADNDNVIVALENIERDTEIRDGDFDLIVKEEIPAGHKIAIRNINKDESIMKYDTRIAIAERDIEKGEWVHTHNARTGLSEKQSYTYDFNIRKTAEIEDDYINAYLREDGKIGIRNEVWIIPVVGCVNCIAERLKDISSKLSSEGTDGVFSFRHPYGCSQCGEDHARTRKILASLANHPNAGAVLMVCLGCENISYDEMEKELGDYNRDRIKFLHCQECEDEIEIGTEVLKECIEYASRFKREKVPIRGLTVGLKCGGSDGFSGITANPLVGVVSDILISKGATVLLTETPEMFGAEHMLLGRCKNEEIYKKAVNMLESFKEYFISHGETIYENPSPGNKKGGITTLEDKSCGCVQKSGKAPINDVLSYGEHYKENGLNLLSGPGNDLVSSTNLVAAGADMILFTTGRGTPFATAVPTLKISTNKRLMKRKKNWIDFDASPIAEGENKQTLALELYQYIKDVASGEKIKCEENGYKEISIFKDGVTL